jgi:hypothetical protein
MLEGGENERGELKRKEIEHKELERRSPSVKRKISKRLRRLRRINKMARPS